MKILLVHFPLPKHFISLITIQSIAPASLQCFELNFVSSFKMTYQLISHFFLTLNLSTGRSRRTSLSLFGRSRFCTALHKGFLRYNAANFHGAVNAFSTISLLICTIRSAWKLQPPQPPSRKFLANNADGWPRSHSAPSRCRRKQVKLYAYRVNAS